MPNRNEKKAKKESSANQKASKEASFKEALKVTVKSAQSFKEHFEKMSEIEETKLRERITF